MSSSGTLYTRFEERQMDSKLWATGAIVAALSGGALCTAAPRQTIEAVSAVVRYVREQFTSDEPGHEGMDAACTVGAIAWVFQLLAGLVALVALFAAVNAMAAEPAMRYVALQPKLIGVSEFTHSVQPGEGCLKATSSWQSIQQCAWMGYEIDRKPVRNGRGFIEAPRLYPGDELVFRRETYSNGQVLESWYIKPR